MRSFAGALLVAVFLAASCFCQEEELPDGPHPSPSATPVPFKYEVKPKTPTATAPVNCEADIEVTSEVKNLDLRSYLHRVRKRIQDSWEPLIPVSARYPTLVRGTVCVTFELHPDGTVDNINVVRSSGNTAMDRAVVGAVKAAAPFPPLPAETQCPYLRMRCRFLYNSERPLPAKKRHGG